MEQTDIINAIKQARESKGLSQRQLSALAGATQSHISKIEAGVVDLQLSSLVQIARALDLEVQLVPKKALNAVKSVVAGFPRDRTSPALAEIRKAENNIKNYIAHVPTLDPSIRNEFEKFSNNLNALKHLNYDTGAFVELAKRLKSVPQITLNLDQLNTTKKWTETIDKLSLAKNLSKLNEQIAKLRNSLEENNSLQSLKLNRPAYSLDDENE
jgi:transcriptional regulator with XRE-family HTH domain